MADDKKAVREELEGPCEICRSPTDITRPDRFVCSICYGKSTEQREAIDAYLQHPRDYADMTMPEYLDRMFEEK